MFLLANQQAGSSKKIEIIGFPPFICCNSLETHIIVGYFKYTSRVKAMK
jgi:hypothetical protein